MGAAESVIKFFELVCAANGQFAAAQKKNAKWTHTTKNEWASIVLATVTNLHMLDFLDTVVLGDEGGVW